MKSFVDVVIPARNRVLLLKKALRSVFDQNKIDKSALKVIIVDDGSDTLLSKQLKNDKRIIFVENKGGVHGPGLARNLGLARSKSEHVCFLDSDDFWAGSFLNKSLKYLKNQNAIASLSLTKPFVKKEAPFRLKVKAYGLNFVRNGFLLFFFLTNSGKLPKSAFFLSHLSSMIFSRKDLKEIKFNQKTKASEDWEFVAEVLKRGNIQIIPKPLSFFRYSAGSNTNKPGVARQKTADYQSLLKKLPIEFKMGLIHHLFRLYIKIIKNGKE